MPRRKQICPKRMKHDGTGEEIEDNSPDSPASDGESESETSAMGSPSPGSPSSPEDGAQSPAGSERAEEDSQTPPPPEDREDLAQKVTEIPTKRPRITDPVHLTDDPKPKPDAPPTSPRESPSAGVSPKRSPPRLASKSPERLAESDRDLPKLVPSMAPRRSLDRPLETVASDNKHHSKHRDPYKDFFEKHKPSSHSNGSHGHLSGSSHGSGHSSRRDRVRDTDRHRGNSAHRSDHSDRHRGNSAHRSDHSDRHRGYQSETKSLAKKYADLFKTTPTKPEPKASNKKDGSYDPMRAVQDMVKAAERRSPVTPPHGGATYHSRFDYLKRLTGSPMSLDALQRVVSKDRSPSAADSKRPSVVQSVSKSFSGSSPSSYHKYLTPSLPTKREASPPPPPPPRQRTPDPDKPLDLSVKPKKQEMSPSGRPSAKRSRSDSVPFPSPKSDLSSSGNSASSPGSKTLSSTLASLEQKFGDDSFMFDRIGNKHFSTPIRQFYMSAFGMGIYSTALNNSYPLPGAPGCPQSMANHQMLTSQCLQATAGSGHYRHSSSRDGSPSPARKSSSSTTSSCMPPPGATSSAEDSSKSYIPSKFLEQAMKDPPVGLDPKKHTNLQCSCGADFETLYNLTLHLQETGHPANKTKNGTQQEYPKLVRGQDMWLNHGSEQTKQILRCMQCGESFKSLPELTVHMIQTKHYANIVGSEPQPQRTSPPGLKMPKSSMSMSDGAGSDTEFGPPHKCPKCKELFDDFESLIQHQDQTGHLIPKPDPDCPPKTEASTPSRPASRQSDSGATRSSSNGSIVHLKRRLLDSLNTEGARGEEEDSRDSSYSSQSHHHETSRIRCENCSERILTENFVEHVRVCVKNIRSPGHSGPERPKSRSRSPIDRKYMAYYGDYHYGNHASVKKEEEDKYAREYLTPDSPFPFSYKDFYKRKESWKEAARPEPDSSQRDYGNHGSVTELVTPPDENEKDDSALKAMECFIERSFTHNTPRKPAQSSSLFSSSLFSRNFFASHNPHHHPGLPPSSRQPEKSRMSPVAMMRKDSPSPAENSLLYQNKYLPPLYAADSPPPPTNAGDNKDTDNKRDESESLPSPPGRHDNTQREDRPMELLSKSVFAMNGLDKTPDKNDNTVLDATFATLKKRRLDEDRGSDVITPPPISSPPARKLPSPRQPEHDENEPQNLSTPKNLSKKYVPEHKKPEDGKKAPTDEDKASSSALQSLQGLVYGKSFNTEHPLDSLQKLIHTAPTTGTSHTVTASNRGASPVTTTTNALTPVSNSLPTTMPGTVILVNPIVTVVSNSKGGSPSLQISLPPPDSPGDKDPQSPLSGCEKDRDNRSPVSTGDNTEHHCDACNRNFNSKGSYRYHQSRCHWSTVKKFRIKEAINTSPYVYLPLDHSAKFNKYYEMANELAGKSK